MAETATEPKIAAPLAPLREPIDSVQPHPRNVRQGDIGALVESYRIHGQQKPLVVQASTGHIVAGNHQWRAAKELGWDSIAVSRVEMTDDQALAFMLADNRIAELGSYDDDGLVSLLQELANRDALPGTGYTGDDIDYLLQQTGGLAGRAGGFLDSYIERQPDDEEGSEEGPATSIGADGTPYFTLNFTVTRDQRATILAGLRKVKSELGVESSAEALVHLTTTYSEGSA